jgi:hypothetical protein
MTSVSARTLVVQPLRERPIACSECPPFCVECCTLRLHIGTVDHDALGHRPCIYQRVQQVEPEAPMRSAVVDCRRWPVLGRAVAPAAADFQHIHDARHYLRASYQARKRRACGAFAIIRSTERYQSSRLDQAGLNMRISEATFYAWRKKYAGLMPSEMRRLRQLEEENAKMKRLVADLSLDKAMLQDVVSRKL